MFSPNMVNDGTNSYFCTVFDEIKSCLKSDMMEAPKRTENLSKKRLFTEKLYEKATSATIQTLAVTEQLEGYINLCLHTNDMLNPTHP